MENTAREKSYPFDLIEAKWQAYWLKNKTFRTPDPGEPGSEKPKYYVLDMFPYPSGAGLHVGHPEGYTATDIVARYKRMKGLNVLHPMGWDAFGLPAEQHAIETGTHPRATTEKNVQTFKRQIQKLGFSYDWDREINTTDPDYYRWTQWIFLKLYEKGLAYLKKVPVNWCPALGTVLANEEVIDGKSERGNHPVYRGLMLQWMLRITKYAEQLLSDLETLDWPEPIKEMQRNWISRSEGALVDFKLASSRNPNAYKNKDYIVDLERDYFTVYTTRPDTLFGATYAVLSPEHYLVDQIVTEEQREKVEHYQNQASRKSDFERAELSKEKTGVFTGAYAINPVNDEKIPIWIADYVLIRYGTGAIMAVPAHDERDFEFAKKYQLPIKRVIFPQAAATSKENLEQGGPRYDRNDMEGLPFTQTQNEICMNSHSPNHLFSIDGLACEDAKKKITEWLEKNQKGSKTVQYRLGDWLFSRQRYWGEPIPIVHCEKCAKVAVPEDQLPLKLPPMSDFKRKAEITPTASTTGIFSSDDFEIEVKTASEKNLTFIKPPLAYAQKPDGSLWKEATCPKCKGPAERETNTMPQWAGSCWYYLRYLDPKNHEKLVDPKKEKYWMPVDLYVGGAEHAVLHLLYSRFWHKVLYDIGVVSMPEPFYRLVNQGMILGEDGQKMSKSRGNVINPDDVIREYGADSMRLYEMFMGPLEIVKPWSMRGVEGVYRFLGRVWRLFADEAGNLHKEIKKQPASLEQLKILHKTIKKVTEDLDSMRFNTAISAMMIFVNDFSKTETRPLDVMESFVLLLSPFAPHLAEELWTKLRHPGTLAYDPWPVYDGSYLVESEEEVAFQVTGKVRSRAMVPVDISEEELKARALQDEKVKQWIEGKKIHKVIVIQHRLVNIVV